MCSLLVTLTLREDDIQGALDAVCLLMINTEGHAVGEREGGSVGSWAIYSMISHRVWFTKSKTQIEMPSPFQLTAYVPLM